MFKKVLFSIILTSVCAAPALARDDIGDYNIKEAMSSSAAKSTLGNDVKFYFGSQKHSKVKSDLGEFKTNKKTNALNKSDKEACEWVFLSAMKTLKERAEKENANAVVNIQSNYKGNLTSSPETFKCGAGAFVAGVALTGQVVKL
ncbi:excinuclease [Vibrio sp. 10N.286.49.B3]|uniref:excinuclease n=1 Tax=Vibrio sp. 10N.286.49.B3 TaxID=1880855 RepID=UPI000C863EE5|nr:excinuclease [Vibrio sp. 10N.286.49.B3]PMH44584.1 excinuclease [Vibrio sp. 10N.286.49.B3]